ncbi:MAG: phosphate/phosphite/phosphonate ABC transporter substrate-binding protein [Gemmataceae bacterium]
MRRITLAGITFFAVFSAWAMIGQDEANAFPASRTIRIGIVNTLAPGVPTALLSTAMSPFRSYMEDQTGASGDISRGGNAFDLAKQLQESTFQVGIFHGHEYAWAKARFPNLEPIVVCVNHLRMVKAYLVVSTSSPATSLTNLEGKIVSLPRDNKDHCRVFFDHQCEKAGIVPDRFCRKVAKPAFVEDSLDDVVQGKAHATVVDAVALERYKKMSPSRGKKLKVISESEIFPPGVVAYDPTRFSESDVKKFREALLSAKENPQGRQTLKLLKLSSFELAPANLGEMLENVTKVYPAKN